MIRDFDFGNADYAALRRVNEAAWPGQPDDVEFWRRFVAEVRPPRVHRRWLLETHGPGCPAT